MYYNLYDEQLDEIRLFSFNSKSKKEVREALVDYLLLGNFSEEGEESIKNNTLDELCDYYDFKLLKTKKPISEEDDWVF